MNVTEFGRVLVETMDLDPVYVVLNRMRLEEDVWTRWAVAYWLFYSVDTASELATDPSWFQMELAAGSRIRRGAERRHFRGPKAVQAVRALASRFKTPEALFDHVSDPTSFGGIRERVLGLPMFGDWIAFKIADMYERVWGGVVDFSDCSLAFYKEPSEGARIVCWENGLAPSWATKAETIEKACGFLACGLKDLKAPPDGDRPLNVQEFETILCKYKSHLNGHYPVGKDTAEIRSLLAPFAGHPVGGKLLEASRW